MEPPARMMTMAVIEDGADRTRSTSSTQPEHMRGRLLCAVLERQRTAADQAKPKHVERLARHQSDRDQYDAAGAHAALTFTVSAVLPSAIIFTTTRCPAASSDCFAAWLSECSHFVLGDVWIVRFLPSVVFIMNALPP